jgi:hypothetical protein
MHEHTDILAIAHRAEALLAAAMGGVVGLRGIGNHDRMPPDRTLGGQLAGMDQHFVPGDCLVVEEVVEPAPLAAVAGQRVQAHGPLLLHRCQQVVAGGGQAAVAEAAELGLIHANRSLPLRCGRANPRLAWDEKGAEPRSIAGPDSTGLKLVGQDSRKSIRSYRTAVALREGLGGGVGRCESSGRPLPQGEGESHSLPQPTRFHPGRVGRRGRRSTRQLERPPDGSAIGLLARRTGEPAPAKSEARQTPATCRICVPIGPRHRSAA